jgi:hypothetical protein
MNLSEVAAKILELRKRPSPFLRQGELMELLGRDGYQTALTQKWVILDNLEVPGTLRVTHIESFIDRMRQLAEVTLNQPVDPDDPDVGDSVVVTADGKPYTATVQSREADGYKLSFTPGQGPANTASTYKRNQVKRYATPATKVGPASQAVGTGRRIQNAPYNPGPQPVNAIKELPQ